MVPVSYTHLDVYKRQRKEYNPNQVARRKRKPIIYIICEGKETETLYFKHFRSRNCLVDIIPISSKHKAAEHLVKHAKSLISQADYYPKDGDQLWCVFDCDDNRDSELQAAVLYAEKHGYKIAYSNPAFEYWYLLHFEKRNGYLKDSAAVIDILKSKGYLENYGKSVDVFEELQGHQAKAIQYAKERVERLSKMCIRDSPIVPWRADDSQSTQAKPQSVCKRTATPGSNTTPPPSRTA